MSELREALLTVYRHARGRTDEPAPLMALTEWVARVEDSSVAEVSEWLDGRLPYVGSVTMLFPWNDGLSETDVESYVGDTITFPDGGQAFTITRSEPDHALGKLGQIRFTLERTNDGS